MTPRVKTPNTPTPDLPQPTFPAPNPLYSPSLIFRPNLTTLFFPTLSSIFSPCKSGTLHLEYLHRRPLWRHPGQLSRLSSDAVSLKSVLATTSGSSPSGGSPTWCPAVGSIRWPLSRTSCLSGSYLCSHLPTRGGNRPFQGSVLCGPRWSGRNGGY